MFKRIPTPEEYELENAYKAPRLNGTPVTPTKLVAASSSAQTKPTARIKSAVENSAWLLVAA